ncbi:MAG: hypothetical protein U1E58_06925 [Tabrizicola sp.]
MRRLVLPLVLLSGPAFADQPQISLVFGPDQLSARGEDIRSVRRIDEKGIGSALVIQLAPAFDSQMRAFSSGHVGETGKLLICGQMVLEPHLHAPIPDASFVISDTDPSRIDRLQALLAAPDCDPQPSS